VIKRFVAITFICALLGFGVIGCEQKKEGMFEKIGKSADETIEKGKQSYDSAKEKVKKAANDLKD
jgi:hypothetical protein